MRGIWLALGFGLALYAFVFGWATDNGALICFGFFTFLLTVWSAIHSEPTEEEREWLYERDDERIGL